MSAPTPATQPVKTKSKAYSSTVAIQGDAAKYRLKYKELKKKVREIEVENDKLHLKTLRIKRNIQRMRLERAILYERLEAESQATPSAAAYPPPPPLPHHYDVGDVDAHRDGAYRDGLAGTPSSAAARRGAAEYPPYPAPSSGSSAGAYRQPPPPSHPSSASAALSSRVPYASAYDDYAPPPPPRSHAHPHAHAHPHPYAPSSSYDSRHHSPQPPPPVSSAGDRADRLRQYTESPSPEPAATRDAATSSPLRRSADPAAADAGLPASSSRSGMKVTLRRAP